MRIQDEIHIDAPIARVWALTLDVESWPDATPTMTSVERLDEGELRVGSRARIVQPRQRPRVWTVDVLDAPRRFRWSARMGSVTMTGGHELSEVDGGTHNVLTLELTGFGSGLLGRLAGRQLAAALRAENEGFRDAVSSRSSAASSAVESST